MVEDWHRHAQQQYLRLNDAKIFVYYMCHTKDDETSITFHQKT